MTSMNDCQFCLSTAPLERRGTISNPTSMPMNADCVIDEPSARDGLLGSLPHDQEESLPNDSGGDKLLGRGSLWCALKSGRRWLLADNYASAKLQ